MHRNNSYKVKNKLKYKVYQDIEIDTHSYQPSNSSTEAVPPPNTNIETGILSVGVFTALQAFPVKDAEVTVYDILANGTEHIHAHMITDENGRIPDIELPVQHDPLLLFGSDKYYYTTYNIRVKKDNFYTVNVLNFRIFPGMKTNYRIEMVPVIPGETEHTPDQTFIIPKSPIEDSN